MEPLGQGLLYESLNLASTWRVPMLFVVENNNIAQTTPTSETVGGSLEARGSAFGLPTWRFNDCDTEFLGNIEQVVEEVRTSRKPGFLVIDTCRLGPHSKGDDLRETDIMDAIRSRDPLTKLRGDLGPARASRIDEAADEFLDEVYRPGKRFSGGKTQSDEAPHFRCGPQLTGYPKNGSGGLNRQRPRIAEQRARPTSLRDSGSDCSGRRSA